MWDWHMWDGFFGGWLAMGLMILAMVIFWGGIIFLIVWGIRRLSKRGGAAPGTGGKSPLDIARERYARGEITKDQYEQLKNDLS